MVAVRVGVGRWLRLGLGWGGVCGTIPKPERDEGGAPLFLG